MSLDVVAGSYAGADAAGIRRLRLDPDTGRLTPVAHRRGVPFPAFLAPSGTAWYAVSETTSQPTAGLGVSAAQTDQPGHVWYLADLEPVQAQPSGGDLPTHLSIHPYGRWLFVSHYGSGTVTVMPVNVDGTVGPPTDVAQHSGSGPVVARQEAPHVHSTILSMGGDLLLAADLGADLIVTYRFDVDAGRLHRLAATHTAPGFGPRYFQWIEADRTVAVVGELTRQVALAHLDVTGALAIGPPTPPLGDDTWIAADIHTDGSGLIYVSNRDMSGGPGTLTTLTRSGSDGLRVVRTIASGGQWPRHFAVTPDGRLAVVANEHSGTLDVLSLPDGTRLDSVAIPGVSYVHVGP